MNERETYRAEIDAKLAAFGETLDEIRTKQAMRNEARPDIPLDDIERKHQEAQTKVKALAAAEAGAYDKGKADIDSLMDDIDKQLRASLAYFN